LSVGAVQDSVALPPVVEEPEPEELLPLLEEAGLEVGLVAVDAGPAPELEPELPHPASRTTGASAQINLANLIHISRGLRDPTPGCSRR